LDSKGAPSLINDNTATMPLYIYQISQSPILGCETNYCNFKRAIEKAQVACVNSGHEVDDHFADVRKMVTGGPLTCQVPI